VVGTPHFQYDASIRLDQLFQGDVLERTVELEEVLKTLYPYAHQHPERYPYFVVLTQSCDLQADERRIRRAEHITLCAARSINLFLENEVAKLQTPLLKELGICLTKDKPALLSKIERLLSNEEYPYFYLHPSEQTPFKDAQVAYLRVTFPLRTDPHYDTCIKAKKVQLAPEFRAKLGWLTTLVFGRVATEDFDPSTREAYAKDYIDSIADIEWRRGKALANEARQRELGENFLKLPPEKLRELIDSVDEKSQPEMVADLILNLACKVWPGDEKRLASLRRSLLNNPNFKAVCSD
jgi:hypothetical protein